MAMNHRLMRPRASGFDPRSISNIGGWWDFADASKMGPSSSGVGAISNNGPIKYVADKSGNGRHMIQSGADSVAPTFLSGELNGRSVLGFDGGDSLLASSELSFTEQTIFAVFRLNSAASSFARIYSQAVANTSNSDGSAAVRSIPFMRLSGASICSFDGGVKATVSVSYDTWQIVSSQRSGGNYSNRVNNGSAVTAATGTGSLTFNFQSIGSGISVGAETWRDRIAEVVMYTRALSDAERNTVAKYLGTKWGITVS